MASLESPTYTATVITKAGTKYNITKALTDLVLTESENGIAQKAEVSMAQVRHEGKYATGLINVHDRLYVFANTGSGAKEVFRGYIWTDVYSKGEKNEITLTAYDRLIYLQESESYKFYNSGKSTKAIFEDLCKSKGIPLKYTHRTMKHAKLVIRGTLADAFSEDLLEPVRKKTGKRGVIRDNKGTMEVFTEGKGNTTVYKIYHGEGGNIIKTRHTVTMDGITTKVIILGSSKDDTRAPIKATVKGNTKDYGTIQKVIFSTDNDKLSELKKEAKQIIKDNGKPQKNIEVEAVDIPWIRKGDKIHIDDGYMKGYAYVKSITHDCMNKVMSLEIRMA